jgi:sulfide:quinone oxidoreductase
MARIVIIGAGLGGLPTAYEIRHLLPSQHQVTVISNTPKFTFIPSLPWVALGLMPLEEIQLDLSSILIKQGIEWIQGAIAKLDPVARKIWVADEIIGYDYVVIATGADLALDALPGLGPEGGYSQSVCNPHHAELARQAWLQFLEEPGDVVIGAAPGASCFGPVYEFSLLIDFVLRKRGLRDKVSITLVTPEPYAGHLGIGGMANSAQLVTYLLDQRRIHLIENAAITEIFSDKIVLADGRSLPFRYSMVLPPFRGAQFLREAADLTDAKGFLPVLPTYQHPTFDSVYGVGVITQLKPPEATPIPIEVPKTGQMTEAMGMAVAHNIAVKLGAIATEPVKPTLEAICFADFGDTGIVFLASPVLPDPQLGRRKRAIAMRGAWVSFAKKAFERYFLTKMQFGTAVPWFERLGLQAFGLSLVEPIVTPEELSSVRR